MTTIKSICGPEQIFKLGQDKANRLGISFAQYIVSLISKDVSKDKITELMDETFPVTATPAAKPLTDHIPIKPEILEAYNKMTEEKR